MKFTIKVFNARERFYIRVFNQAYFITEMGWHGGEFSYGPNHYEVRGPYHGLLEFQIFKLESVATEIILGVV